MSERKNNKLYIQNKIKILEEYPDFSEEWYEIFKKDIENLFFSNNKYYKMLLIDFSIDEVIFNKDLYYYYYTLLQKENQLIKLAVLDYLFKMNTFFDTDEAIAQLEKLLKTKYLRNIVKNQIYINLIYFKSKKNEDFQKILEALILNLSKTVDYRSHIRIYNYIIDNNLYNFFIKDDILTMIKTSKNMNLPKSVQSVIERLLLIVK